MTAIVMEKDFVTQQFQTVSVMKGGLNSTTVNLVSFKSLNFMELQKKGFTAIKIPSNK